MLWWTLQQLKSSSPDARIKAAQALGSGKQKKAVPPLIKALDDPDSRVRRAVVEAFGRIGHPASAEPMVAMLAGMTQESKSAGESEYEALAQAIASLGAAALRPLVQALASGEKETRRWAAYTLGLIREPQAVAPLIERLEDSRSEVRKAACTALGEIGDVRALKTLVKTLESRDTETRRAAASALGSLRSAEAVDALAGATADPAETVQLAAVHALGKIGGMAAAASLRSAMAANRKGVCEAAGAALKGMHFSPGNAEERAELAVIQGDFEAASREGQAAVPALIGALELKDPQMRAKAAKLLAQIHSPESVAPLLEALKDHNASVQESAAEALARIGEEARPGLEASLSHYDASVVRLAAAALGKIGNPLSVPALADLIIASNSIPGEYPDLFDAVAAALNSLNTITVALAQSMSWQQLERMTLLPDQIRLQGVSPRTLDCSGIRSQAAEELRRRA